VALRQTFEEAVQTHLYPRSQIDVNVLVIEQDGGIAIINKINDRNVADSCQCMYTGFDRCWDTNG